MKEAESQGRKRIPFSAEVVWAIEIRKHRAQIDPNDYPFHLVPETPQEKLLALKRTERIKEYMRDELVGRSFQGHFLDVAATMVKWGQITEEQFLEIHKVYNGGYPQQ